MQNWRCQLAFSVRSVRAGKRARFSTDVVQSDETEKQCSQFVLDDDVGGHTWPGDPDFLSASDVLSFLPSVGGSCHLRHANAAMAPPCPVQLRWRGGSARWAAEVVCGPVGFNVAPIKKSLCALMQSVALDVTRCLNETKSGDC